jgi:putative ABC transport system substrate-binding protein
MVNRRTFVAIAGSSMLAVSASLRAQGAPARRRIGTLYASARPDADYFVDLLRPELDKLGWTDGRNIVLLEPRSAEGRNDRLPSMAAELVAQGPDIILVQSAPATRAAMQATKSIPIVMIGVGNPVEYGIVASHAKPGGNVTGSTYLADESIRKALQLLKETVPRLRSVAVFTNPTNEAAAPMVKLVRMDAERYGIRAQFVDVSGPADFEAAFAAIRRENTESILLPPEPLIRSNRERVGGFAQAHGLPLVAVGPSRYLPTGGLLSYGPTGAQYAEITARYIDRILKGAKPGDLPVEEPPRFELAINFKTAKVLGLTIPPSIQARADERIE